MGKSIQLLYFHVYCELPTEMVVPTPVIWSLSYICLLFIPSYSLFILVNYMLLFCYILMTFLDSLFLCFCVNLGIVVLYIVSNFTL